MLTTFAAHAIPMTSPATSNRSDYGLVFDDHKVEIITVVELRFVLAGGTRTGSESRASSHIQLTHVGGFWSPDRPLRMQTNKKLLRSIEKQDCGRYGFTHINPCENISRFGS